MNTSDVQAQKRRYGIVGNSEGLNHAVDIALQVAKTDLSVLITGESGVGKGNHSPHYPRQQPEKDEEILCRELRFHS